MIMETAELMKSLTLSTRFVSEKDEIDGRKWDG